MVKFSLFLNGLCFLYLFWLMKKTNGYQPNTAFAMTICITSVIGFIFATNLQLFMVEVKYSLVIVVVASSLIGVSFGFIHSRSGGIIGYYHGFTAGLMGAMLSLVIYNPSICHLPVSYADSVEQHAALFSLFSCILSFATIFIVQLVNWKIDKGVNDIE